MEQENTLCFNFKGREPLRVRMIDGEPWFLAMDISDALNLVNGRKLINSVLLETEKRKELLSVTLSYRGKTQTANRWVIFVNESGLYTLIMRSDKPEAKEFRQWVTSEVLPSIRKTGSYTLAKKAEAQRGDQQLTLPMETSEALKMTVNVTLTGRAERIAGVISELGRYIGQ